MSFYNHKEIEPKWQKYWADHHTFKTGTDASKPKFYALDMFPYPSGAGLHVGHPEGYTATDILSRFKRAQGYNVLHPMGWDAFGLPAEQYAMDTGNDPAEFTAENIANFKRQINALGFSYDWDREVNTTDPNYYKWTQWIFTKLYEKGLAYEAEVPVTGLKNWEQLSPTKKFFQMEPLSVEAIQLSANQCVNGCLKSLPMLSVCSMTWMILIGQSLSRTCNATGLVNQLVPMSLSK